MFRNYYTHISNLSSRDEKKPSLFIQPRLTVNQPNDEYEREADAVADDVMQTSAHRSSFFSPKPVSAVQRKTDGTASGTSLQTEQYIGSLNGGKSLSQEEKTFFEPRFGHDFSDVQLHTNFKANESANDVQAKAYTHGNHIVFGANQYQPDTNEGKQLIAHELTHVVQQGKTGTSIQRAPSKKESLVKQIIQAGFVAVEDRTASFSVDELTLILQAINGLPPADKTAIKGARIVRVNTLPGTAAGDYTNEQGYNETTTTNKQEIRLNDKAFTGGISPDESVRLVTHEIGHAVAAMKHRLAMNEESAAGLKVNQLTGEANKAVDAFNADNDKSNAAIEESNIAIEVYNEAIKGDDKKTIAAAKADVDKKKAIVDKLKAITAGKKKTMDDKTAVVELQKKILAGKEQTEKSLLANVDDLETEASGKLADMEKVFNGASGLLNGSDVESSAYRTSVTDAETALRIFYDENVKVAKTAEEAGNAKAVADAAIRSRNNERDDLKKKNAANPALSGLPALEAAQDSFLEAASLSALNKVMTLPVRKFFDFVRSNNIPATLTKYASENWPHKPEEFYAEAYSYFVTKPKELEAYSKPLYDWFKAGNYK